MAIDYHDGVTRGLFAREILRELGVPKNAKNMVAMLAWMEGEGTKARNNPLATTRAFPRSTAFNKTGVKNYATLTDGVRATVETLRLKPYAAIRAALAAGNSVHATTRAIVESSWGTQHVSWKPVNDDPGAYAAVLVAS